MSCREYLLWKNICTHTQNSCRKHINCWILFSQWLVFIMLRNPCSHVHISDVSVCCVSSSFGSRESIWSDFIPDGCEHRSSLSGVRPLLDVSDGTFLLQHPLAPHGRTGSLPHHPAAAHHGLHRYDTEDAAVCICASRVLTVLTVSLHDTQSIVLRVKRYKPPALS